MPETHRFQLAPVAAAFVLLGTGLLAAVPASAHSSPDPLAVETRIVEDETTDAFAAFDGYDVSNVYVRDAHWSPVDETGVVFRVGLYGGPGPAGPGSTLEVGFQAASLDEPLSVATEDGDNWTGDLVVVQAAPEPNEAPEPGHTLALQAFASRDDLGLAAGESLSELTVTSSAGGDVVDRAPGGWSPPGTGARTPVTAPESQRLVDAYELGPPTGYVNVSATRNGSTVAVDVDNELDNGQHVELDLPTSSSWSTAPDGPTEASIDAGGDERLSFVAEPDTPGAEPFEVALTTDLGGRELVTVTPDGVQQGSVQAANVTTSATDGQAEAEEESNDSPGPGAVGLAAALAAGLALARRRGR